MQEMVQEMAREIAQEMVLMVLLVRGAAHPAQDLEMGQMMLHFEMSLPEDSEMDDIGVGWCTVHDEPGEKKGGGSGCYRSWDASLVMTLVLRLPGHWS